jgi:hypothetical protein
VALAANALTTVQAVKTELAITGASEDTYVETLINRASDAVERFCNRVFYKAAAIVEKVEGYGGMSIKVARAPILAVTSITYDGATLDGTTYEVDDVGAGIIRFIHQGPYWTAAQLPNAAHDPLPGTERKLYQVTYDAGYVTPAQVEATPALTRTLPYDVEEACILACVDRYKRRGRDPSVKSESLMSASVDYVEPRWGMDGTPSDLPHAARALLTPWRRLALA